MNYLLILAGFIILILGGNWLLKAAVGLSLRLNIPKIVIGMTVVSFATSAPELIVSVNAAMSGFADISLGNVIGSNIANLGLVLGIVIVLSTISVEKSFYITDWPVMMFASILFYLFIKFDGIISRGEGIIFVLLLVFFLIYLLKFQKKAVVEDDELEEIELPVYLSLLYLSLGGLGLWAGSELLVKGAVNLANELGVSERVIGVTIISIGTSVPELAASVIAIIKKEKAISLGNLLGSNIFNIFGVIGVTSIITPIKAVDDKLISYDLIWMLVFAIMIFPLVFTPVKMKLSWKEGLILLGCYTVFITLML
ncbi:calcium/sodium antiporter [Namhaeicola litoreus]|uniref:Calcium/sodium antiporter n=1 Tax=Namhaeicola litoreus TaxID=1052145 RepID=A0ABW3XWZ9_9FLAO